MSEEKEVGNKERERYIEELISEYSCETLNEIVRSLDLNPADYPNKMAIAQVILEAREREETRSLARKDSNSNS